MVMSRDGYLLAAKPSLKCSLVVTRSLMFSLVVQPSLKFSCLKKQSSQPLSQKQASRTWLTMSTNLCENPFVQWEEYQILTGNLSHIKKQVHACQLLNSTFCDAYSFTFRNFAVAT